ncbi:MAG TPA: transposase family protein [Candidatus Competibacteraceae bacterium]|nr:transposase family protein [Candidatus Competibacteraceae bacterium]HRZ05347.1 transposase family protein [Candidatus Competibacteraceae bacterium]HSA45161.1 transposase family protein [Candidatus Competibacteraceae bacterium]
MRPALLDPRPYFADLPDPRRETRNKRHKLQDILIMVRCTVFNDLKAFAEEKEAWLRGFLD